MGDEAPQPSDEILVEGARAGQRQAIEALLGRYQERVFRFGLRMCGDAEDAKDVVQETLLAAASGLSEFRGDSSLSTWLYTIARSFCLKTRRRSQFAPAQELSLDEEGLAVPSSSLPPDELAARREVKSALVSALAALEPAAREVLILRDIEGLTAPEVAEVTHTSVDAVKSRLHRARAALRLRLEAALGEEVVGPRQSGCPDVLGAFSRQLEGDLEPRRCVELQEHVDGCATCRATCHSLRRTLAACASAPPGLVPNAVKEAVRAALGAALARAAGPEDAASPPRGGANPSPRNPPAG